MKVKNMVGYGGNSVANQFEIYIQGGWTTDSGVKMKSGTMFQSYDSCIAYKDYTGKVYIDKNKWDYSTTTGKYRNIFLGETKKETERKIKLGEYTLMDLN